MLYVIATLRDKTNLVKYRLLNTDTGSISDIDTKKFLMKIKLARVENLNHSDLEFSGYATIDINTNAVSNNKIIILFKNNSMYTVTDYTGRLRDVSFDQIQYCDRAKLANIHMFREFSKDIPEQKSMVNKIPLKIGNITTLILANMANKNVGDIVSNEAIKASNSKWINKISGKIHIEKTDKHCENSSDTVQKIESTVDDNRLDSGLNLDDCQIIDSTTEDKDELSDNNEYTLDIEDKDTRRIVTGIYPSTYAGKVEIPDGVTHIKDHVFSNTSITSIELPESLVYIGDGAFSNSLITEIHLPSKITAIPHFCFDSCRYLNKVNFDNILSIGNFAFSGTDISEVVLKQSITQIGKESFSGCKSLIKFEHPKTLRKIRDSAFSGCVSLEHFDFDGVSDIEAKAFYNTGLKSVNLSGDIGYIQPDTFSSPNLVEVILGSGCRKLGDAGFYNNKNEPITYTIPKETVNFGVHVFKDGDIVRCFHNTVAESVAKSSGVTIEYLDDRGEQSKGMMKAGIMGLDVVKYLSDMITDIYSKSDIDYEYDLNETGLINTKLSKAQLDYLRISSVHEPEDYEEKSKFKILLDHYRKACPISGFGLSSKMIKLKNTFSVTHTEIYSDGVSRILEFLFKDHKFESKTSKFIVALTGDRVRYCCLNNRCTNIYCKTPYSKDLSKLLSMLVPGDTLGYDCVLSGKKYTNIASKGDQKNKNNEILSVNPYQAIFNCSIAVKLDGNYLALILPVNNKVIKCVSIGKDVWRNENDESYKDRSCVIEEIQDLDNNTVFEYGVNSPVRDNRLFYELSKLDDKEVEARILDYSTIKDALLSPYVNLRNYCFTEGIEELTDLSLYGLGILMNFPIIEERTSDWFDKSIMSKTIIKAEHYEFELADGTIIYQYRSIKRMAMRNKLIVGGDRTIYIYEIIDSLSNRRGVFSSTYDLESLFDIAKGMGIFSDKADKIYQNVAKLDIVPIDDMVKVTATFSTIDNSKKKKKTDLQDKHSNIWLTVYKPNGLYYLSYIGLVKSGVIVAVPLIQVGDFKVLLDYIDCTNTYSASGYTLLNLAGRCAIRTYKKEHNPNIYNYAGFRRPSLEEKEELKHYNKILQARELVINNIRDIDRYMELDIPPVIAHMFGINTMGDKVYEIPDKVVKEKTVVSIDIDDIDDFELDF